MAITRLPHARFDDLPAALVAVDAVSYTYPPPRRIVALRDISLTIARGEFVGIVGHNGSGKTTLTKCVSGHLRPRVGRVSIAGRDVARLPIRDRPKFVGYTFQNPDDQLFHVSVWDEVRFGLRNLRYDAGTIDGAAEEMLRDLGLWDKRDLHPYQLSKGDRQRLAIAVVAVMQPLLLIVDEPTTGQDPVHAREIMDLLEHLRRDVGLTVVVITHAMDLVAEYCTRAVVMYQGRVLLDDSPQEVFRRPEILAQTFVQPPPIVLLALRLGLGPLPTSVDQAADLLAAAMQRESGATLPSPPA
jgi:energy-coupling factor transporter ATP-binding protein EcfA2